MGTNLLHLVQVVRLNPNDLPSERFLDLFHLHPRPLIVDEVDRDTLATKTTSSSYNAQPISQTNVSSHEHSNRVRTDTMDIRLDIRPLISVLVPLVHERQVVVHDHVDLHDIDTTRDNVSRDEDLLLALSESVDDGISLSSVLRPVQRRDFVALCGHPLRDAVGGVSMLKSGGLMLEDGLGEGERRAHFAEDDTLPDRQEVVKLNQDVVFVFLVSAVHVELTDALHGELLLLELDLVRIWCEFGGEGSDVVGEGSGEENDLGFIVSSKGAVQH